MPIIKRVWLGLAFLAPVVVVVLIYIFTSGGGGPSKAVTAADSSSVTADEPATTAEPVEGDVAATTSSIQSATTISRDEVIEISRELISVIGSSSDSEKLQQLEPYLSNSLHVSIQKFWNDVANSGLNISSEISNNESSILIAEDSVDIDDESALVNARAFQSVTFPETGVQTYNSTFVVKFELIDGRLVATYVNHIGVIELPSEDVNTS